MQKLALLSIFTLLITGCSRIDTNTAPPGLPEMNIPTVQTQAETAAEPAAATETPAQPAAPVAEPETPAQPAAPVAEPETQAQPAAPSIPAIQIPTQETQTTQTQPTETQATETESQTQAINLEQSLVEWLGEKIVGASHPKRLAHIKRQQNHRWLICHRHKHTQIIPRNRIFRKTPTLC